LNLETFHFLRPEWLWSLLLLIPLGWSVLRRARSTGPWERVCDPHLLPHLVAQTQRGTARGALLLMALGWSAASIALAGPAWERLPQQTFREPDRTVFVLGLGESMSGRDVRPSRIARARHKLLDAVDRAKGGSVALVVYREEAFAVTPLTDDANVLREVIPLLDTKLMPGRTVRTARGIDEALRLLEPVGARGARIVLVTDGADDDEEATAAAVRDATDAGARVSVLAVAGLSDSLTELASSGGGASAALAIDDGDLDLVLADGDATGALSGASLTKSDIRSDDWKDMGAWLLWIPLALAPFAFRRGWAAAVAALLFFQFAAAPARAADFDLFQRPDQKGASAFAEGRFEESAQHFEDPAWQAAARYRAGDFAGAAEALAPQTDPLSQYNLGNALAKAGKLEDAVAAYDRALATAPSDEDARFNRELVKKLLEEQPPQEQQQQSKDDASDSKPDESQQQQDSGESKGDSSESKPDESQAQQDAEKSQGEQGEAQEESEQGAEADEKSGEAGEQQDEAPAAEQQQQQPQEERAAQQADPADAGDPAEEAREGEAPTMGSNPPSAEDQQRAQWMARLPDDPGGLLRERIRRDFLRKRAERSGGSQ
jgi:Ca-activated chloride channel family protein